MKRELTTPKHPYHTPHHNHTNAGQQAGKHTNICTPYTILFNTNEIISNRTHNWIRNRANTHTHTHTHKQSATKASHTIHLVITDGYDDDDD